MKIQLKLKTNLLSDELDTTNCLVQVVDEDNNSSIIENVQVADLEINTENNFSILTLKIINPIVKFI